MHIDVFGEHQSFPGTDPTDPRSVAAFNIKSLLGLPIIYEQHLYGLIFLFDCGKRMNLTEIEIQSI